ncbi:hypothetical protein VPH35_082441 [Triticum aestivum]
MAAWRCCAAVEAAAVQGNKPWRRAGRARCVLWMRTGRVRSVGTAGTRTSVRLTLGGDVYRRCARVRARVRLHPSGVCRWRLTWRTRRQRVVSVWCGRTRQTRRAHAGRARRTGAVGLVGRARCARGVRDTLLRSGASGARGTCGAPRDVKRVSPVKKMLGMRLSRNNMEASSGEGGGLCSGGANDVKEH